MLSLEKKHWHHLTDKESIDALETDEIRGLTSDQVYERQKCFGLNQLSVKQQKSNLRLFFSQFNQPLIYILLAATLITLLLKEWVDASVIFGVVLVNAVIGFMQERKAIKAIAALANAMNYEATVIRDKQKRQIAVQQLVPGDLVLLQSGDKVPADLRLLHSRDLYIDESSLTGESVPVAKNTTLLPIESMLVDQHNMAFSTSLVTYGVGKGVVVTTGDATEIGKINALLARTTKLQTPLLKKMEKFSQALLWVILFLAGMTFLFGIMHGESWLDMFMAAVALAVGAIPEGLPAAMTITLGIGVARMAQRNAIIRKLPAVETLGSTTVICSDKTGTLTQNQMTVARIIAAGIEYEVTGAGYTPHGKVHYQGETADLTKNQALSQCLKAGVLCNEARLFQKESSWCIEGDPTEAALIVSANKGGLDHEVLHSDHPRCDAIPFESEYQYMATVHHHESEDTHLVYLKGSVESILSRCQSMLDESGNEQALKTELIEQQMQQLAAQGMRVLAFARTEHEVALGAIGHDHVAEQLVFLGLQGMIDPPRKEVIESIQQCHTAGISVKMITGDHGVTALAIAKQIGLLTSESPHNVMMGAEIQQLNEQQLIAKVQQVSVFARIAPEQKLRLVEALQAQGEVVAMTGDGVNDAPALKQADIGVAMGREGTEVAKEAADMVLTDDNFSSIVSAVQEGRGIYDNLIKFITWTLPTNVGEGLVILMAVLLGTTLPILPVQILWINMTTAICLGLMLAFEPKEQGIMIRPPRLPNAPILGKQLILRIIIVSVLLVLSAFWLFHQALVDSGNVAKAHTMAVNVFVFGEMLYLFNCRKLYVSPIFTTLLGNPWLLLGAMFMTGLQVLYTYWTPMQIIFHSAPLTWQDWGYIGCAALVIFLAVSLEKQICKPKVAVNV
ncbi:cation-transporting P-type ATPase [Zooshikella sp. RANM57]|uniref:cation-transporting P-type ATPase n=1 Tax=Zooshikella sp. RANM57 TaxID=3425863 RepID=UPI003D6F0700